MKTKTSYKFILYKIKKLITDQRGYVKFIDSFDSVFEDIFDVKNFCRKINDSYDNYEIVEMINSVGLNTLMKVFSNSRIYNSIDELIQIEYRLRNLKKEIRKQSKKGKRDKQLIKEYDYLSNLYKKAVKTIRRRYDIKPRATSYKRKYQNLNSLTKKRDDYEFDSIFDRDDSFYFSDDDILDGYIDRGDRYYDDDDDEDNYEDTSELEDFERMMNGRIRSRDSLRKRRNRKRRSRSYNSDALSDFLDDDDDEDDEDDYITGSTIDSDVDDKIDKLNDVVMGLTESVQRLIAKDEFESGRNRRRAAKSINVDSLKLNHGMADSGEKEIVEAITRLSTEMQVMRNNDKTIAEALDTILQKQDKLEQDIEDLYEEYDEDDGDIMSQIPKGSPLDEFANRYAQPTAKAPSGSVGYSRDEMIDLINQNASETSPTTADAEKASQQ